MAATNCRGKALSPRPEQSLSVEFNSEKGKQHAFFAALRFPNHEAAVNALEQLLADLDQCVRDRDDPRVRYAKARSAVGEPSGAYEVHLIREGLQYSLAFQFYALDSDVVIARVSPSTVDAARSVFQDAYSLAGGGAQP